MGHQNHGRSSLTLKKLLLSKKQLAMRDALFTPQLANTKTVQKHEKHVCAVLCSQEKFAGTPKYLSNNKQPKFGNLKFKHSNDTFSNIQYVLN